MAPDHKTKMRIEVLEQYIEHAGLAFERHEERILALEKEIKKLKNNGRGKTTPRDKL